MSIPGQTDPVEVVRALEDWLGRRLPADEVAISDVGVPAGGHSGDMISFTATWSRRGSVNRDELIVRLQPGFHQLFLDPDVLIQWHVMEALAKTSHVPVPRLILAEPDPSVLGRPFFVMGRMPGRIPRDTYNVEGWMHDDLTPAQRSQVWCNGLDVLAALHDLDWRDGFTSLDSVGPGATGLEHYVAWVEAWYTWARGDRSHPVTDAAMGYVIENRPSHSDVSVLWGDARPGNIVYGDDLSVVAVLDWEMAALGPGEVDLGWWLFMDDLYARGGALPRLDGLPDRDGMLARYERGRGRPVRCLEYYEVLAGLRMATVLIRWNDSQVASGAWPTDSTFGVDNTATTLLARRLGLKRPPVM